MPIYTVRHLARDERSSLFDEPLTHGAKMYAATHMVESLKGLKISAIYCSPFIRCVQTILPFSWASNIMVRLEFSLFEYDFNGLVHHMPQTLTRRECTLTGVADPNVIKSVASIEEIKEETEEQFIERVRDFKKFLIEMYRNSDENILICTHMSVLNVLHDRPLNQHVDFGEINTL